MTASVASLPVMAMARDIASALKTGNVLLSAEPGAGKSTGLPLALLHYAGLDASFTIDPDARIILLEPRRLAARAVAERLAAHLGEKPGQRIGLRMRSDTRVSAQTRLEVVTEGVLTRMLQTDPTLDGVGLVIFDEFHERSLHADLGLTLCLEVQQELRNDLRLLLMSATLHSELLHARMRDVRQFQCAVRQHPVEIVWVGEQSDPLPQRAVRAVLEALSTHAGDVLVFLPGVAEIDRTAGLLRPRLDPAVDLHCLHGRIGQAAQMKATAPAARDRRRVILATSIAETSITIDGVQVVVDCGLERRARVDNSTGAQRLETLTASQASATQRAGRAGRTAAGVCYRLWSETAHPRRPAHWEPEIRRADLAPLLMELGLWGAVDVDSLPWLEAPPAAGLSRAAALLTRLGLWEQGRLTAHGRAVAGLPVHLRLGHMLVWAARHRVLMPACRLAVLLDDPQHRADALDLEHTLSRKSPAGLQQRADQLARLVAGGTDSPRSSAQAQAQAKAQAQAPLQSQSPAVILAQAFPDWIAQRRAGEAGRFQLACGSGALIDSDDALAHCPYLAVAHLGGAGTQARIFHALALDIDELQRFSPELFTEIDQIDWDDRQGRVLAERRLLLGSVVIDARPLQGISDHDRSTALLAGIRRQGVACLPWTDDCREWQARVLRMRELVGPEKSGEWPLVDDNTLLDTLEHWLLPWIQGMGSMKALQQLDLHQVLTATLDYTRQTLLDAWLPVRYTVPSGSRVRLLYTRPGNPVLSVRLQEMLGCASNPVLAQGRVVLKVELLSPARRPVQVTEDLVSFWTGSYPAVKKEMAGRYPRHAWPDDPLAAEPTARAKRRK